VKTLELFNVVLAKPSQKDPVISEEGFVIESNALWAEDKIKNFYKHQKLVGKDLNKTFHKSFAKVRESSRYDLLVEQIRHYMSTYGSDFQEEIYIPNELLEIPEVNLTYKVVRGLSREELTTKCLDLLKSGIALKEETIDKILSILDDELEYQFTGKEGIRNKEAIIKIAKNYGVVPDDTMEFFRYCIYMSTGESLLIKNQETISLIKSSRFNPSTLFKQHGLKRLSRIFNRFKPLFLAYKSVCPKTINKISKLSKQFHKPLVQNPLNSVTSRRLTEEEAHWLTNATPFALFKALSALHCRINGQTVFNYRIRNGKSWVKEEESKNVFLCHDNFSFILNHMRKRFDLSDKKIYLPENVEYALPTSEKMFVGNIPTGTKFIGEKLAVGVYWKDEWGARDLDLSAVDISGAKIGWNSAYSSERLTYSGDITSAPNGAVEYLHCNSGDDKPWLIKNNVYTGESDCGYKIIVGQGDDVSKNYMMDPNKVMVDVRTEAVQKNMVLGMLLPKDEKQCFVLLNFGAGHAKVSSGGGLGLQALVQQYENPLSFRQLVTELGAEVVEKSEEATLDLSLNSLTKDSFVNLFN